MAAPDPAAVARFRHSIAAALATSDRSMFVRAAQTLSFQLHVQLPELLYDPLLQHDAQVAPLLALATDLCWMPSSSSTASSSSWASLLKPPDPSPSPPVSPLACPPMLDVDPSMVAEDEVAPVLAPPLVSPSSSRMPSFLNPAARPFVPVLPNHPVPLPTAIVHTPAGPRASFRSWKWRRPDLSAGGTESSFRTTASPIPGNLLEDCPLEDPSTSNSLRPAIAVAHAAIDALSPFLPQSDMMALRRMVLMTPPLHALSLIMRAAHMACTTPSTATTSSPLPSATAAAAAAAASASASTSASAATADVLASRTTLSNGDNVSRVQRGVSSAEDGMPWSAAVWRHDVREVSWRAGGVVDEDGDVEGETETPGAHHPGGVSVSTRRAGRSGGPRGGGPGGGFGMGEA